MSETSADSIIQKINRFVTIKKSEKYLQHYHAIVAYVLNHMKDTDPLFCSLYNGYSLVGSYPDGLKVTKPDEFDVNIRLKFKKDYELIEVASSPRQPGFCNINLRHCISYRDNKQIKKILDSDGYLIMDKVNTWMHSIFKKFLSKFNMHDDAYVFQIDDYSYKLFFSLSGPAYTLKLIVLSSHIQFSVDLVVGFVFENSKWIACRKHRKSHTIDWYAVPKPFQKKLSDRSLTTHNGRSFVCSYANIERTLMHDLNTMKCLVRLYKKLRDTQNLTNMISFHIKTIFLWQINRNSAEYWNRSLMELFLEMFEKVLDVYTRKRLPSFWDPSYNLLGKFDPQTLTELEHKLRNIRKRIVRDKENNPEFLIKVFLTDGEIRSYHRRK